MSSSSPVLTPLPTPHDPPRGHRWRSLANMLLPALAALCAAATVVTLLLSAQTGGLLQGIGIVAGAGLLLCGLAAVWCLFDPRTRTAGIIALATVLLINPITASFLLVGLGLR